MSNGLKVLRIDASGRHKGSSTRALVDDLVKALTDRHPDLVLKHRDLTDSIPHVDHSWIEANFTAEEERSAEQRQALRLSDELVAELRDAELLVIGLPIYNFGIPAAMKAWVDMVARARLTFRYTENGPVGLLEGKKVLLVVASGGVGVDSQTDFATPYMRQMLKFVGITEVEVIAADQQNTRGEEALSTARARISEVVEATPASAKTSRAA